MPPSNKIQLFNALHDSTRVRPCCSQLTGHCKLQQTTNYKVQVNRMSFRLASSCPSRPPLRLRISCRLQGAMQSPIMNQPTVNSAQWTAVCSLHSPVLLWPVVVPCGLGGTWGLGPGRSQEDGGDWGLGHWGVGSGEPRGGDAGTARCRLGTKSPRLQLMPDLRFCLDLDGHGGPCPYS